MNPHGRFWVLFIIHQGEWRGSSTRWENLPGTESRHRKDTNNTDLICKRGNGIRQQWWWQERWPRKGAKAWGPYVYIPIHVLKSKLPYNRVRTAGWETCSKPIQVVPTYQALWPPRYRLYIPLGYLSTSQCRASRHHAMARAPHNSFIRGP